VQPHSRINALGDVMPLIHFERQLTVGGIGTSWVGRLAAGNEAGRTVLLRRMSKESFSGKDVATLKKVAEAYSKVRHPSLVKLLGVVEQDDDIISVSEHLDGVRFCDLLRDAINKDAPLPATVAVRVILDAARVTTKAHHLATESGLFPTERLFVPESVFIAAYGGTLLTETGVLSTIARCAQPRSIPEVVAQLAPEEIEGATSTKGSPEVFSLGVLLWETLANRYLFSRAHVSQTLEELRTRPITPLAQIERCGMPVPDALAEVVRIATNRNPSQRFADVCEFVSALEELPVHFMASEHHVASTLRDQASELLREFHVDPSQSSLTVAFSEVPASRLSTRPPTEIEHNWEPPTFAQRRLLASAPIPANSLVVGSESLPSKIEPHRSAELPGQRPSASIQRLRVVLGVVLALLAASVVVILVRAVRPTLHPISATAAPIPSEPAVTSARIDVQGTQVASAPIADAPIGTPQLQAQPSASLVVDPSSEHAKTPTVEAPSTLAVPESKSPAAARKSDQPYRPRNIAPYRPKGI
jgi:hypothetical protein